MNALLQIIIVCPDQCIAEIPGVFAERIVVDTEAKGFHIFNHKHGGGSCISLAEGVNLPNIRRKLCKVLNRCFNRQTLIRKLLFGGKVIIQGVLDAVKISVNNRCSVQYFLKIFYLSIEGGVSVSRAKSIGFLAFICCTLFLNKSYSIIFSPSNSSLYNY